ncbi:AfsR/SARP family transcriptional regulator [Streptomonospora salina]|uniref:DNA-binding SARP family transcriptional activator/Flp pilus assembly protein TadD n=1 Tax=Streptomonospora salina TaxID=104205 RepID=A0A841ECW1_9ACTN|nr:BTAD domain-containing putative transcriptional regulator [Streptomonospora salina]MBB5998903.1 DNA-binding SARP family transcriptional activator/Flp pilus assembly protein TadD [Streptomonospora salina]
MNFGVLGPISAWSHAGDPLPVGGPRQRCVLGTLLLELGKEVTVDRLIEYLWDDDPPRTARSVIQVQISHLRRSFPDVIKTTAGGYLARVDPDDVDLHRFRSFVARAKAAGDPAEEVVLWDEALTCWRGQPFSGTGSEYLGNTVVRPLLEERWSAWTAWAQCAFALHRYTEIVSRVTPLVRQDPFREQLQYFLIAALYRSGQRASALSAFQECRAYLAEELGVDPSPEVMELHGRILRETESDVGRIIGAAEPSETPEQPESEEQDQRPRDFVARNDLPRDIPDFTGRENDLERLLDLGTRDEGQAEIAVITGLGGAGKTTLAVHGAHRLADRFPDGLLFTDLYGYTIEHEPVSPASALGSLLRAIGVQPEAIPETVEERAALWRASLTGRRVLIVLDNVANFAQISPLLAAAPGSFTIVTSRQDLPGLSGAQYISLGMLDDEASLQLFAAVLGQERIEQEHGTAHEVVRMCGGLPLALRIVAGRMLSRPRWTFEHVKQRLSEHHRMFRELRIEGHSVEAVFELSYQSLNGEQRRAFLTLGVMIGGTVDLHGAAALLDCDPPEADDLLQELVSVCLLEEPSVDLYRFHDLLGSYAREKAATDLAEGEAEAARRRLGDHYLAMADRAAGMMGPRGHDDESGRRASSRYEATIADRSQATAWFERHQDNLASAVDFYAGVGLDEQAWQLADSLWRHYANHGQTELMMSTQEKALAASRANGNVRGSAATLIGLGIAHCLAGRFSHALELLNEAWELLETIDDERGKARVNSSLSLVYERMGRFHDALSSAWRVLEYALSIEDRKLEALQRVNLAIMYQILGDDEKTIEFCQIALSIKKGQGEYETATNVLRTLGEVHAARQELDQAFAYLDEALDLARFIGSQRDEIYVRNSMGVALRRRGDVDAALGSHRAALDLGEEIGQHSADAEILTDLGTTFTHAGRVEEAYKAQEEALSLARDRGELYIQGRALMGIGRLASRREQAVEYLAGAAKIFVDLGVPEARQAEAELEKLV